MYANVLSLYISILIVFVLRLNGDKVMSKTIAYIRTSTDNQDLDNQRLEIYEYNSLVKYKN